MLPVVAFIAWEEDDEEMREQMDMDKWWQVIVELCTGMRILHSHKISYREAGIGVEALAQAAKGLLALDLPLKPNWHIAMHYAQ